MQNELQMHFYTNVFCICFIVKSVNCFEQFEKIDPKTIN